MGDGSIFTPYDDYIYSVTRNHGGSAITVHGKGCEVITGYTAEEFDADLSLWVEMIDERDRPLVLREIARLEHGESPRQMEHRIIHKSGDVRWIRNVIIPHRNSKGQMFSYDGVISDITDHKRTAQRLALQYEVTRQLAECGTWKEACVKILKAVCDTLPWDWAAFWSFDQSTNQLYWENVWYSPNSNLKPFAKASRENGVALGEGVAGKVLSNEKLAWVPDLRQCGNFPRFKAAAEVGLRGACGLPLYQGGNLTGVLEFFSRRPQPVDPKITEMLESMGRQIGQFLDQKLAEEELRMNIQRLTLATQSAQIGIWEFDFTRNQLVWNSQMFEVYGVPLENFEGTYYSWEKCVHPEDVVDARTRVQDAIAGKKDFHTVFRVIWPDGQVRSLEGHGVVISGDSGTPQFLIGVNWDITERVKSEERLKNAYDSLKKSQANLKKTELQLIQAAKMESIGALAAGVAHEVKNPLQAMLLGLTFLEPKVSHGSREAQAIKDMQEAVTRANVIVSELLLFGADTPFNTKREDLNSCILHTLDILKHDLIKFHINVEKKLGGYSLPVCVDIIKIEQVLINLIMNSIHAIGSGGTITITTRMEKGSGNLPEQATDDREITKHAPAVVVAEFQDTGPGIPEDLLSKVFDPFVSTKPKGQGTGLGLAVVKRIVDLHKGSIEIGNAPGGGAIVRLILKIAEEQLISTQ
jgi:two-component system, sensor histidine kinase and response regulator